MNRLWKPRGRVFAHRYHAHALKTPREVRAALAYVLLNARHHAHDRGLELREARIDPCSSGAEFDGWKRTIARAVDRVCAEARVWLLRVGWRRWGLIDFAEVPAAMRACI